MDKTFVFVKITTQRNEKNIITTTSSKYAVGFEYGDKRWNHRVKKTVYKNDT